MKNKYLQNQYIKIGECKLYRSKINKLNIK